MSYADVTAQGPPQTAEEKRAPPQPQVELDESITSSSLIDVDSPSIRLVSNDFADQPVQTETQATRIELEERAKAEAKAAEEEARRAAKSSKDKLSRARARAEDNSQNPVVLANAVAVVGVSAALGFGAYRKYAAGELSWKVVGTWTGIVGLFAVGDYYLSRYLFKTRYPAK